MLVKWFAILQNVCTVCLLYVCQLKCLQDWSQSTLWPQAEHSCFSCHPLHFTFFLWCLARIAMGDISHFCKYMGLNLQVGDVCICCIKVHLHAGEITFGVQAAKAWKKTDVCSISWTDLKGRDLIPGERGLKLTHNVTIYMYLWLEWYLKGVFWVKAQIMLLHTCVSKELWCVLNQ